MIHIDQEQISGVLQAVTVAICTWYIRRGSKTDTLAVKSAATAGESTLAEILNRLKSLETDMSLVKRIALKETLAQTDNYRREESWKNPMS